MFVLLWVGLCFQDPLIPPEWKELAHSCTSLDPDDRDVAHDALIRLAGPQREPLRKAAREGHEYALIITGLLGDGSSRAGLIRLLTSEDLPLRRAAAEALAHAPGEWGVSELAAGLDATDLATALAAARALARTKGKAAAAALRKAREGKDERKALIAAHGLELAEPGSQSTFIRQRLNHDIGPIVAANAPSVSEHYWRSYDEKTQSRDPTLRLLFEKEGLPDTTRDAIGMLCVRSGVLNSSDVLRYLKWPTTAQTSWALTRAPRLRRLYRSCLARELIRLLGEGSRTGIPNEGELKHLETLENLLTQSCGARPHDGDVRERAQAYQEWYNQIWTSIVDLDVPHAIDAGVAWLRTRQAADGSWRWCQCGITSNEGQPHSAGMTALVGYTLLKMEVPAEDPAVQRAAAYLLNTPINETLDHGTYSLSLQTMFLGELVGQFKGKKPNRKSKVDVWGMMVRATKRIQECIDWLVEAKVSLEVGGYDSYAWSYTKAGDGRGYDHSNTQFALLGLLAGQNAGAKVPLLVWQGSLHHWKSVQLANGGWAYATSENRDSATTSMTAAGISSVLIAEASSRKTTTEKIAQSEGAITKAITKFSAAYPIQSPTRSTQPGHSSSAYYDLYSIERAMMLGGFHTLGGRDWYHDGALFILWNQMHCGAWIDASDTCFALLFLKKAYIPVASGDGK